MNISNFILNIRDMLGDQRVLEMDQKTLKPGTFLYTTNYDYVDTLTLRYNFLPLTKDVDYEEISLDTGQISFYMPNGIFASGVPDAICMFRYYHVKFSDSLIEEISKDGIAYINRITNTSYTIDTYPEEQTMLSALKYCVAGILCKQYISRLLIKMGVNLSPDINSGGIKTSENISVSLDSLSFSESSEDSDNVAKKLKEVNYWKSLEENYLDLFERFMGIGKYKGKGVIRKMNLKLGQIILEDAYGRLNPYDAIVPRGTMYLKYETYNTKPLFRWTPVGHTARFVSYVLKRSSTPITHFDDGTLVSEIFQRETTFYRDSDVTTGTYYYAIFAKINPSIDFYNNVAEADNGQMPIMSNNVEVEVD